MAFPAMTNNSPAAGSIAWGAFTIQYQGATYSVAAGSTSQRWVWWKFNNGAPSINAGAELPSTLVDDDLVLFRNKDGIGIRIQSATLIDGELIVDGSIVADAIATNQINSQHIVTVGLDAGVIKFGEMSGDRIAVGTLLGDRLIANSINVSKLTVQDMNNYVADGFLVDPTFSNWDNNGLTRVPAAGTEPAYIQWTTVANGNAHRYNLHDFELRPGDEYYFVCEVSTPSTNTATVNVYGAIQTYNAAGATVTWPQLAPKALPPNSAWQEYSGSIKIGTDTTQVKGVFDPFAASGATAGQVIRMRKMQLIKKANGKLIVDGEIDSLKIVTQGLSASVIKFDEMSGDRIAINTLNGNRLIANSVTTRELSVVPAFNDGIALNPTFNEWPVGQAVPTNYSAWTTNPTRETAIVKAGLQAVRYNVAAATQAGINAGPAWGAMSSNEPYVVATVDFRLVSGALSGAGLLVDFGNGSGGRALMALKDEVLSPQLDRWYRATAVIPRPAGYTANGVVSGYIMANYSQLGALTAKDIIIDFVDLRPATQLEIDSYLAGTWRAPGLTTINGGVIQTDTLNADAITSASLKTKIVTAGAVNSITITGSTFQTDFTGNRMVLQKDVSGGVILGYTGHASEIAPGYIDPGAADGGGGVSGGYLLLASPNFGNTAGHAYVYMWANGTTKGVDIWGRLLARDGVNLGPSGGNGLRNNAGTEIISNTGNWTLTSASINCNSVTAAGITSTGGISGNTSSFGSGGLWNGGTQIIDSSRNLTNINTANFGSSVTIANGGSLMLTLGGVQQAAIDGAGNITGKSLNLGTSPGNLTAGGGTFTSLSTSSGLNMNQTQINNAAALNNTSGDIRVNVSGGVGRLSSGANIKFRIGTDNTGTAIVFQPSYVAATTDTMNAASTSSTNTMPFYAKTINGYGAYVNASDAREKENIEDVPVDFALDVIKKIRMRSFDMANVHEDRTQYGVIAQEARDVFPSMIFPMNPDDTSKDPRLAASYQDLWALAVVALQEVMRENTTMKERLDALEANL